MRDIWEIGEKVGCFAFGHDFVGGVCRNCGEDRRR